MKLGAALLKLDSVKDELRNTRYKVVNYALVGVPEAIDELNQLVKKQQDLVRRIRATEAVAEVGGALLHDLRDALQASDEKIKIMELVLVRTDLSLPQRSETADQLKAFRHSRNTISLTIERCLWETELLDE
jgi:2-phospho-L-lactate guanylyltransferase (CobY/MobA/RfbA family)